MATLLDFYTMNPVKRAIIVSTDTPDDQSKTTNLEKRGMMEFTASHKRSSSQEKPLQPTRRPQKKFSLANAFPPLTSPRRCLHYRQQQHPPGPIQSPNKPMVKDEHTEDTTEKGDSKFRTRKGSEPQTRKFSAPVDYRDSGVYLGDIVDHDPLIEMWNKLRKGEDSFSKNDGTERSILGTSVPEDGKLLATQTKTRVPPPAPLNSSASSKSLPAINAISLRVDQIDLHRSTTCGHRNSILKASSKQQMDHNSLDEGKKAWNSESLEEEPTESADQSPNDSPKASDGTSDTASGTVFNLDEGCEYETGFMRKPVVRKKSSLYRRSKSLAEDETNRPVLEDDPDITKSVQGSPNSGTGRHLMDGDPAQIRKVSRKGGKGAMLVQAHSECESIACDGKNVAMVKKKRSLADPIAKKLTAAFLRRKVTGGHILASTAVSATGGVVTMATTAMTHDSANSSTITSMNSSHIKPPTREEVRKWASSFEHLLNHKYGAMLFRTFLQREFSEENIDFWIACEEYKKLREAKFASHARQIYNDFVAVQAPKEVNLDSVTRSSTMAALTNPNRRTFEQAQHRIQSLMEKDSYPRFLRSDLYLDLARKC